MKNGTKIVIASTAYREIYRDRAREFFPDIIDTHVDCPVGVSTERDPKGIYEQAMQQDEVEFLGIHELFDTPEIPLLRVDSAENSPQEDLEKFLLAIREAAFIERTAEKTIDLPQRRVHCPKK